MTHDTYAIAARIAIAGGPDTCSLKAENLFCVLNGRGDIAGPAHAGLYYRDTRFVSAYALTINGTSPVCDESLLADDNSAYRLRLSCDVPDATGAVCRLNIERTVYLSASALRERIDIHGDNREVVRISVGHTFAPDFSDIFEVRGDTVRKGRGELHSLANDRSASFRYDGQDGVSRQACIQFDPDPQSITTRDARHDVEVKPGETVSLGASINCEPGQRNFSAAAFAAGLDDLERQRRTRRQRAVRISGDNEDFDAWLSRSLADLDMLLTETESGPYPYAGLPWFSAPFGRDGIITALQALWLDPSIARGVLGFLARTQATEVSREHDAEPGKILHEVRMGELANTGVVPFNRYYGSVDATPLFVMLAGEYLQRTGDLEFLATIWPAIEAALQWIDRRTNGFLSYERMSGRGLANQGWKDSVDSVFHADGSPAEGPIALCEVQGYVFAAKRGAAAIASALGKNATASRLLEEANSFRQDFERQYWSDDLQCYVLALDGDRRQCAVRTSNAGHLLLTGIATSERAGALANLLSGPSFFSGWGIRTVAATEAAYDPLSYHNGSVWPHDTSLIAMGLARYGLAEHVDALFGGMLAAAKGFALLRLPELFSGHARGSDAPIPFPHACAPQAWSAAAPVAMLGATLGVGFDAAQNRVTFRKTRLPPFLGRVTLSGLGIGEASADLTIQGDGKGIAIKVENAHGDIEFAAIDSPELELSLLS